MLEDMGYYCGRTGFGGVSQTSVSARTDRSENKSHSYARHVFFVFGGGFFCPNGFHILEKMLSCVNKHRADNTRKQGSIACEFVSNTGLVLNPIMTYFARLANRSRVPRVLAMIR